MNGRKVAGIDDAGIPAVVAGIGASSLDIEPLSLPFEELGFETGYVYSFEGTLLVEDKSQLSGHMHSVLATKIEHQTKLKHG